MQKVIGVRFKKAGKIHFFDPGEEDIKSGDSVIVETARGIECADVVIGVREIPTAENSEENNIPTPRKIQRKATPEDLERVAENKIKEKKAFDICLEKIKEHGLPMNLINVNYTFDLNKIIFYFTADGRVDFRALVRDLAYIFHTRIELRQVGVRDEAKLLGGVGCCGRPLCCANFLGDFVAVSIRMAKEQNLSLNPTKISGICGRLLCCLKYENDYYHEHYIEQAKNYQPKIGDRIILENGKTGKIVALNEVRRNATILVDSGKETVVTSWETLLPLENGENVSQIAEDNIEDVETEFEPPPNPASAPKPAPAPKSERPQKNVEPKKNPNRREDSYATNLFDNHRNEKVNKKMNRQRKNPNSKGRNSSLHQPQKHS